TVAAIASDRIVEFVGRPGVQSNPQTEPGRQTAFFPICVRAQIGERERELPGKINIGKDKVKSVAPGIPGQNRFRELLTELRDPAEKMLHKARDLGLPEFAETNGVCEQNGDDARRKSLSRRSVSADCPARFLTPAVIDRRYGI